MIAKDSLGWSGAVALWAGIGVLMVATGWFVIRIAERAADGRLGPNAWAGIRTRATRSSDEAWVAAHERAKGPTVLAGWLFAASGPVAPAVGWLMADDNADTAMVWWVGVLMGFTTVATVVVLVGARQGHVAAQQVAERSASS